uniref:ABC transporter domain-containing protein n=1 Tax=Zonotrichia albicollis TaxID=44394 RepID=A0A8D2NJS6_ZONAL
PCVLFLILAAIRFQEPPKYKENCYLEARDLPSGGLYPFLRSLFCNVGSRCRNASYTAQRHSRSGVPSALRCTFTWLQAWTEIFEEASEILSLNSTFFVCLRDDLAYLSENLLNVTQDELCNNTAMAIVEAAGAAMKLLKSAFQEHGNLNDLKDFETFLVNFQSVINNTFEVTNLLKDSSLESVLETIGAVITKMQKSILKIVNEELLNSWLDAFISGASAGEDKGAGVFSIENSLSTILKLSQEELEIILTEINDTSAFLKSVPRDKYMACISIFQNITKLILDNSLKDISNLQTNFSSHLNSFLNFHSTMDEAEDCNTWIYGLSNPTEKNKSPSHLESLMNVMDFINLVFNLTLPECSLGDSDVVCASVYFNIIAKTLKFILPELYVKHDINVLEFIFKLLNNSGKQIQTVISDLVGSSLYMSNETRLSQSTRGFNRTSRMLLNPFHHISLISVELLSEIQSLLKNKTFDFQENSSSHLDNEIEPFLHGKNISLLMEFFQYMIRKLDSNLQNEHKTFPQKLIETLYQEILQAPNGALLWTFLKPLLHGKILYNSNISMIDLVMEKVSIKKCHNFYVLILSLQFVLKVHFFQESNLDVNMEKLLKKMKAYGAYLKVQLMVSLIDLLTQLVVNISSCVLLDRFQPFDSIEKLEEKHKLYKFSYEASFLLVSGIIFSTPEDKKQDSSNVLPRHISYTIRTSVLYSMRTDLIKNPTWKSHPHKLPADGFKYNHVFIPLQDMIERAIISAQTGTDTSETAIQVQAMPYPCHTSDLFLNNIGFFFPLMMMLTWMVSVAGMVRKLVYEREIHLEEYMKTMGVYPAIHFFAWFLENVIVLTVSSCALAIILKASGIFAYSNGFLIFLFLLEFGVTVIMLSYFLGAFFSSADTAALCASLVYMISFLPYIVLLVLQNQLSFTNQIIMCLLSTTAFGQGIFFITYFEGQEIGIQWDNVHQSTAQGGYMTFGWMCWMMFFDSILYFVGGWYFSNIFPGKFGLKNRWYFPFTVSYWKNLCGTERSKRHYLNSNMFFFNEIFQEKATTIGVVLLSLTKEHVDGRKAAVKDLNLTFHKGQITALLGPNGAGKTTVISLLTGLYPPSSGTIIVDGKDIRTELAAIRTELGVCPQYDVLFNTLTVREHLLLYGSVKAPTWTKEQLDEQVTLEDVDLSQHQYKPVGALSGGMKRRLSIAISFIGNSKTVVLDEPTSGVDPCSRRSIWDVLLKYKAGCTLIFTTHHLDEAEVLSDRIAILQRGQLRCCGSPSYLRETYGQGHSLTLIKKDPKHIVQVTSLVQTHIPEAFLKDNSGTELTYVIPEKADKTSFKGLFQALDQSLQHLHVTGYGISDTTLEEVLVVFLSCTKFPKVRNAQANGEDFFSVSFSLFVKRLFSLSHLGISLAGASSVRGAHLVLTQIVALVMKRFHHTRRDWRGSLSNVLLPVLFVALAMALFSVKPLAIDYPSLQAHPSSSISRALGPLPLSSPIIRLNIVPLLLKSALLTLRILFFQMCPTFNTSAPYVKNKKGHILYNLSGFPVEEYLVWYNQKGFHSLPSYLNELNNFILWLNLPSNVDWRLYGITLYSQPYGGNVRQCGVALCIMLGFSILTASVGTAIVRDRVSGTKRLQHITGLGYKTYWLANFCCDMLFYMIPVTLCVGVISAFQLSAFTFRKNLAATVLLLILFGYATLPWMYLASRFFSSSDVAFISYISLNFVFGLKLIFFSFIFILLHPSRVLIQSFQNIYTILKWAFIIFPQFCLGQGLIELSYNQIKFDLTRNFGIDSYVSPFEMDFLGWIFVAMSLQGTLLLLLRLFLHWDLLWKSSTDSPSEDVDVEMERQRLFGGRTGNDVLLLYNLRKCYGGFSKKNTAVENISLGIPRGECFGLLGTNGAGKSTTFKMLTGDIIPSAGRAVIRTPTGSEGILIGYCPQQDALDELLTGWEHLYYYCTLRGIPKQDIHKVTIQKDLVNRLHLNAHADKLVRTYSAGTKRKLSTAVALVGKPQILLLDEPSSGMDPCSKRYLWKAILKEVQDGCAAVLTSHSMEECEALCTRLAIMVNGAFKCLGSPQHIKNRFGEGYSVKVWLSKEISYGRMILDCLQMHFPGTQFKGQHLNLLEYHVPRSQGCLAELFRVLENHKTFLQIKHYSISQTTLEQVFYHLSFFSFPPSFFFLPNYVVYCSY